MSLCSFGVMGSALSVRTYSRLGGSVSALDYLCMGSTMSLRSYARMGSVEGSKFTTRRIHVLLSMHSTVQNTS